MSRVSGWVRWGMAGCIMSSLAACGPMPGTAGQGATLTRHAAAVAERPGFATKQTQWSSSMSSIGGMPVQSSGYYSSGPGGYSYSWGGPINQGVQGSQQGQFIGSGFGWGGINQGIQTSQQGQYIGGYDIYGNPIYADYGYGFGPGGYSYSWGGPFNRGFQSIQQGQYLY